MREVNANSDDKVPVLGDVPVVGNLFKTQTKHRRASSACS